MEEMIISFSLSVCREEDEDLVILGQAGLQMRNQGLLFFTDGGGQEDLGVNGYYKHIL